MATNGVQSPPSRVFLITHSRTASHLLAKMLSNQPNCMYGSHHFRVQIRKLHNALRVQECKGHSDKELDQQLLSQFSEGYEALLNFLHEAEEKGKIAFVHNQPFTMIAPKLFAELIYGPVFSAEDHGFWMVGERQNPDGRSKAHTNLTILPDEIFLQPGTRPIISFRHPAIMIEGICRAFRRFDSYGVDTEGKLVMIKTQSTLRWNRMMYDWFSDRGASLGIKPIVVEADDYMGPQKESVMRNLCQQAGLDPEYLLFSWQKATDEEVKALPLAMQEAYETINSSEGVLPGYALSERDLNKEMREWDDRFGEDSANLMRELVEKVMPDYEYLKSRRTVGV